MTKEKVIRRVREKLAKVQVYNYEALRTWGPGIASEMFQEDLDFLSSLLLLLEKRDEVQQRFSS